MAQFDYVVIGGGSAGRVLPAPLPEDPPPRLGLGDSGPPCDTALIRPHAGVPAYQSTPHLHSAFAITPPDAPVDRAGEPRRRAGDG